MKSKLPNVGTTIFTKMSTMANEYNALNLSQGFPDFDGSSVLHELVQKNIRKGHNQYAPMQGEPTLREAIAYKTKRLYGHSYDKDLEITVTAGATQAIFTIITACVFPGDEVIVFGPAYDCYEPAITLCGAKTKYINLKAPDYKVNFNELSQRINEKTRMIIINSPHNPTGAIWSDEDMLTLEKLLEDTEIIVLSDEVYEHILFDGQKHCSIASYPGLAERAFSVSSFGKTYHITGWKLGYCLAPKKLMAEFRKVHQFNVFSCNNPMQKALAEFMEDKSQYLNLPSFYQGKRDLFVNGLKGSRFKFIPTEGTYFQLLDYSDISDLGDVEMAEFLVKNHGIASIPISVFYDDAPKEDRMLRFCFAKSEETIAQGCEILNAI
ncbi:MAG: methionine aminotransferase [Patiriisocius sp.]